MCVPMLYGLKQMYRFDKKRAQSLFEAKQNQIRRKIATFFCCQRISGLMDTNWPKSKISSEFLKPCV